MELSVCMDKKLFLTFIVMVINYASETEGGDNNGGGTRRLFNALDIWTKSDDALRKKMWMFSLGYKMDFAIKNLIC